MANWQKRNKPLSLDLFLSRLKLNFILVNGKLAENKFTFSPDLFTSIFELYFIPVNGKLAEKKFTSSLDLFISIF